MVHDTYDTHDTYSQDSWSHFWDKCGKTHRSWSHFWDKFLGKCGNTQIHLLHMIHMVHDTYDTHDTYYET